MKILILCTGNSCRSQMAHGFLQSFDKSIMVRSAGTQPAKVVHPFAVQVMSEVGVDISAHSPTDVREYLGEDWDYVVTVCGDANETCPVFTGNVKHRLHIGFKDPAKAKGSPVYVMDVFRRVRRKIYNDFARFYIKEICEQELPECSCRTNTKYSNKRKTE